MPFRQLLYIPGSVNPRGLPVFADTPERVVAFVYQSLGRMLLAEHIDALAFEKTESCALCFFKVKNFWGARILRHALTVGTAHDVADVLALGVPVDLPVCDLGCSPLLYATQLGPQLGENYRAIVQVLVEGGADVNAAGPDRFTPLMNAVDAAAEDEQVRHVVRILLAAGADVAARDISGNTPLHLAAARHLAGIAQMLIEHGADWQSVERPGRRPMGDVLNLHVEEGAFVQVRNGSDVRSPDRCLCSSSESRSRAPARILAE
jgi:hypothetical protein